MHAHAARTCTRNWPAGPRYREAHHATAPEPDGLAVAALLEAALAASGVSADEVDHINAHGTGTPQNDRAEALGIRRVFGDRASDIPVTSSSRCWVTALERPARSRRLDWR